LQKGRLRDYAQNLPVWQHHSQAPVPERWPLRQRIAQPERMKPLMEPVPEPWRLRKVAPPRLNLKPQRETVPGHWPDVLR